MTNAPTGRLVSLDALRGLDMLVILGLDALVVQVAALNPQSAFWCGAARQFGHVEWEGLAAYDLVFPLFVFMAGMSMCFSLCKAEREGAGRLACCLRLWYRAAWLVLLGFMVNGDLSWDLQGMRFASVLGLIGLSGALAGGLALAGRCAATRIVLALLLLGGVGAAQYFGGDMGPHGCVNAKVDALLCPGLLHHGSTDPEGPLCIVSATSLCLAGVLCGQILLCTQKAWKRVLRLSLAGAVCLAAGFVTGPVIKNIWTPAFVLAAAGCGYLLVAAFHLVIDIWRLRVWCYPLRVVGMNALFVYTFTHVIPFRGLTTRLFGGTLQACVAPEYLAVSESACGLLLAWLLCFYLYRKGIFIRL